MFSVFSPKKSLKWKIIEAVSIGKPLKQLYTVKYLDKLFPSVVVYLLEKALRVEKREVKKLYNFYRSSSKSNWKQDNSTGYINGKKSYTRSWSAKGLGELQAVLRWCYPEGLVNCITWMWVKLETTSLPFQADDKFQMMLVVLPAVEFLELQQIKKNFSNSSHVIIQNQVQRKISILFMLFSFCLQSIHLKHVSSLVDSTSVLYSVRGSLLYEKWESVPLFLPWCDVFRSFCFYPAAPSFLPIVIFSFFHVICSVYP